MDEKHRRARKIEKKQQKIRSRMIMKRLSQYLLQYKVQYAVMIVAIILGALLEMQPSMLTKQIVDDALYGRDFSLLIKLIFTCLGVLFASQIVDFFGDYLNTWTSEQICKDLKTDMFNRLIESDHEFFLTHKQGEIYTHMNSDVEGTARTISGLVQKVLSNIATVVTTMSAMFALNWRVALIGFAFIPFLALPAKLMAGRQRENMIKTQRANDEMNQFVAETLSENGSVMTKSYNQEEKFENLFAKFNGNLTDLQIRQSFFSSILRKIDSTIFQVAPLVVYFVGGLFLIRVPEMDLTVGTITAMVSLLSRFMRPIQSLLNVGVNMTRSMALFERIFDYLGNTRLIVNSNNPVIPEANNKILEFENVSFANSNEKGTLDDVSFSCKAGDNIAIVGPSGCGRNEISKIIPRIFDIDEGIIKLNGTDIQDIDIKWLRDNIGIAVQRPSVLPISVKDNILFGNPNASNEEIENACRLVGLHDAITSLPEGYDTVISNDSPAMSIGELEKLCIARALIKNPEVLILDEATEELSISDECKVQQNVINHMKDDILLIITQHEEVAKMAKKIIVLDKGKIVASGTYEELKADSNGVLEALFGSEPETPVG